MADAQRGAIAACLGSKVVHHHVNEVVGLPQILHILLVIAHKIARVDRVSAVPLDVFHAGSAELVPAFIVGGQDEVDLDVLTAPNVGAVQAALVEMVYMPQDGGQARGTDILLGVGSVLIEYMEYHGQPIGIVLVDGCRGVVIILVYLLRGGGRRVVLVRTGGHA